MLVAVGYMGFEEVRKRWLIQAAARNLGWIMRALFGIGTARTLQGEGGCLYLSLFAVCRHVGKDVTRVIQQISVLCFRQISTRSIAARRDPHPFLTSSTGC